MGTTPDQLRDEIEQTRAGLTHNVDTLAEKISPSSVAHRRMDDAKDRLSGVKEKVMGSAHSAGSRMGDTGSSVSDRASGLGSSLSDKLSDGASSVSDAVTSSPQTVKAKAQGNPLAAGLIAFGAGLLASSMLPASQREQQAATALKDKAQPLAKDTAQQLKESLAPVAQDAVQQVKETAQEGVSTTKERATQAAGEVTEHAKSAAAETKGDVAEHASEVKSEVQGSDPSGTTVYPSDPLVETEAPSHPNFVA